MDKKRTSLKMYKNIGIFLVIIFLFGIISGILFYYSQDLTLRKNIILNMDKLFTHNVFALKNIFIHLSIILIIIASNFIFLSPLIFIINLFLEGVSLGFIIPIFFKVYKMKCFYFLGVYFILIKVLYLLLLGCLFIFMMKFYKEYIRFIKMRKIYFFHTLKKMFLIAFLIIVNDIMIYFLFNKLLIFILG